jgi:hypothetical protein
MRHRRGAEGGGGCAGGGLERASIAEALGGWRHSCLGAQGAAARWFGGGSYSAVPVDGGLTVVVSQTGAEAEQRPSGAEAEEDYSEE